MIEPLNLLGIAAAVYGNHEFDFGVDVLVRLKEQNNFPWMISNVKDAITGKQLADGEITVMVEHAGIKIGLMGIVEREWLATLNCVDDEDVIFEDPSVCCRRLGKSLKHQCTPFVQSTMYPSPHVRT
jgi:5'-nucleotidase